MRSDPHGTCRGPLLAKGVRYTLRAPSGRAVSRRRPLRRADLYDLRRSATQNASRRGSATRQVEERYGSGVIDTVKASWTLGDWMELNGPQLTSTPRDQLGGRLDFPAPGWAWTAGPFGKLMTGKKIGASGGLP